MRPALEVADVFRAHGPAWRRAHAGRISLGQLKVMSAVEACRTAELGGHVERCQDCAHVQIAYNSCRNRHCPKCQGAAAQAWLEARQAELLAVAYYQVVFTVPAEVADTAYQNQAVVYDILLKAASQTLLTIAADPKHLGARIGVTAVLQSWGSAMTHHPHAHCIVPRGGLSADGQSWISCRPRFFLPVRVLSRLFLDKLADAHLEGRLGFFGDLAGLADRSARLAPLRRRECSSLIEPTSSDEPQRSKPHSSVSPSRGSDMELSQTPTSGAAATVTSGGRPRNLDRLGPFEGPPTGAVV